MSEPTISIDEHLAFSYKQAAEVTGYSVSHITRMVREGHLKPTTPPGSSKPVILREDLNDWLTAA